jgi:ubiquinol-cytochrome c reductase cytochrome c1 subunit
MKKIILTITLALLPLTGFAAGGAHEPVLDKYTLDLNLGNKDSLRNGAKLFVNYCLSCHSAAYMRYNRMGRDLGLTDEQVANNLMFVADFSDDEKPEGQPKKIGELMTVALKTKDAKAYFGTAVPDLTVVSRSRGSEWLYDYLNTFYVDEKRNVGVNNVRFKNVGMPHVLWELEGLKKPVYKTTTDSHGKEIKQIVDFEYIREGKMTPAEYQSAMNDLVNFMTYMGEPIRLERQRTGIFVLFFLAILFVFAYMLKKEYWKDIH